jgi:hypothetical protein
MDKDRRSWTEYFRIITPFFLFILTLLAGSIQSKLNDIDTKLFKHLTNDEIHSPKSLVITKPEFLMYQAMRDLQIKDVKDCTIETKQDVKDIKNLIEKHMLSDK